MYRSAVLTKYVALLLSSVVGVVSVFSQTARTPMVRVEHFSIEQGLSDRDVNDIVKDHQGFVWVATSKGLNRFDGYGFLNYDSRPRNKHKIRINKIYAVLPDRAGNLLIIYDSQNLGEIDLLDPLTGRFTPFNFDSAGTGFKGKFISSYQAPDGAIYFLTKDSEQVRVYQFDEASLQFIKVYEAKRPDFGNESVVAFLKSADGTFWFAYSWLDKDLLVVQADASGRTIRTWEEKNFALPPGPLPEQIWLTETARGEILFTLENCGVYVLAAGDVVSQPHPQLPPGWYEYARDKLGNLLAYKPYAPNAARDCFLITAGGQVLDYRWIYERQAIIDKVFSDDFTSGFLAGSGDGFNSFYLRPDRFKTFLAKDLGNAPYGLSIRGMAKSGKDKLFIATERDGLFELDLRTNTIVRPGDRMPRLALLNRLQFPRNLLSQGDSVVWISGLGGVLKYNHTRNDLVFYQTSNRKLFDGNDEVWGIAFGKDGNLWIAQRDGRLLRLHPASGEISVYRNKNGDQPLEKVQPSFILFGREGMLWVGTALAGLIKIDPEKGESRRYSADPGDPSGFNSNYITCIHEDESGLLWVGTMESGLHVFDPRTGQVTAIYSRESGLRNNSTVGILPDDKGNYWVSTFSGLSYFDTKLKTFRNYTTADGLSHNEFNRYAYFFDPEYGRFYFGGMNGVNAFDQNDPQTTTNDAPLLIAEMSVTGQKNNVQVRHEGIVDGTTLTLAPGSRFLQLRLALGTFHNPGGNQFSYKIEGLDQDWNYLGANRDLRIDQLPTGTYVLHLRGADNRGNWSSRELTLRLVVQEFWYKRWWAYLLYAGLLAAGGFYFYQFQLSRRLAEKETQRLQQLDTFKTRFFTNISHEFRTPLTVILGMVDALKKHFTAGAKADHEQAAEMIRRNSGQLLSLVNQLLELSRLESGKLELNRSNGDLTAFLRYQLESFHSYAQIRHIRLQFESEVSELEMAFDQEKIQTILVNLISNALKFTPEAGQIKVALGVEPPGAAQALTRVHIRVNDTGAGIPADKLDRIFDRFYQVDDSSTRKSEGTGIGLALVQELVKLMKGTISMESRLGAGTTFYITLPYTPPSPTFQSLVIASPATATLVENDTPIPEGTEENDPRPLLLIVEDNPDVRFFIAECVKHDYRIKTAENGAVGIQKAIERIPDLIVSDVMMPEKDGFELCETLKNDERTSHIPIVLLTARADVESRIAGLKRGADDYLAKPFEPAELQVRLENLLKLRRRLQQRYAGIPDLPAPSQDPDLVLEDAFLQKIRDVVEAHLSETDFEMPQLERAMGMSRSQVFRKVKALTGASPSVLIRNIRLHKAKALLQDHSHTIAEIAYEVGFSTPAYFSTMFLEAFGKTPSEWRQG